MYLSESKFLRMLTLCGLYVAQGIPWGFVTVTFAAWLATPEHGLTAKQIGPIMAVASLPWSFKFVWGPLMDRFTLPSLGRRRPWILFAQGMAILVLGSMLLFEDLPGMVWTAAPNEGAFWTTIYKLVPGPLAAMILLANVFVSMQDVAVDALAVDLLKEEERGFANGMMYGCSYLGTALGGAGLGFLVARYGIRAGLLGQAVLLFLIMLLPLLIKERRPAGDVGPSADGPTRTATLSATSAAPAAAIDFGETPYRPPVSSLQQASLPEHVTSGQQPADSVLKNLLKAFSLRATILGVFVALGVKLGIGVLTAVFVDYLLKDGGWSQEDYTTVTGGYAVLLGLGGSILGGVLADKIGPKPMIIVSSGLIGVLWIGFGVHPTSLQSMSQVKGMLMGQEFLLSVLSVSLFSLFMSISWPRVAATQFTSYMALMNLSTTIGSYLAGRLSLNYSIPQLLIIAGILQVAMVAPVLLIDPKQTRLVLGDT